MPRHSTAFAPTLRGPHRPLPANITAVATHRPGDALPPGRYIQRCWTGQLGPTTVLLWTILAQDLLGASRPGTAGWDPGAEVTYDSAELAATLGVLVSTRGTAPLARAFGRMEAFRLARWQGDDGETAVYAVRLALPPLNPHALAAASSIARAEHADRYPDSPLPPRSARRSPECP